MTCLALYNESTAQNISKALKFNPVFRTDIKAEKLAINFSPYERVVNGFSDHFVNLTHLTIHGSTLTHIEYYDFIHMDNLTELYMVDNKIDSISHDAFDLLDNLTDLTIQSCQLEVLPEKIFYSIDKLREL